MFKKLTLPVFVAVALCATAVETSAQTTTRERSVSSMATQAGALENGRLVCTNVSKLPQARIMKATSDYGTEVKVMEENFEGFASGSFEAPDMLTNIVLGLGEYEYPWMNMKDGYTSQSGWGAANVYCAGGSAYLCTLSSDGDPLQAHINTPMLDVSDNGGIAFIRFKARTKEGTHKYCFMEAAETFNMSPTWDILGSVAIPEITSEWKTYEFMFYGGGKYTLFNLVAYGYNAEGFAPIYIDDLEVFTLNQFVATPLALAHKNYTSTGFDAYWTKVADADKYLLDVFSLNIPENPEEAPTQNYLFQNREVNDTTYRVEGITSGETYYYQVSACKGDKKSIISKHREVFDLEVPTLNEVTDLTASTTETTYTASWNNVPSAERYNYLARFDRKAETTGEFVVTNEDFTGITDAEGNPTEWTIENPTAQTYDEFYIKELKQAGWALKQGCPYKDFICVDGWQYLVAKRDAGFVSPDLDLSKDGGKFNVSLKLAGKKYEYEDENGTPQVAYPRAAVALFNYDENFGDYKQAELKYVNDVNGQWQNFNVELTSGSEHSVIGIYVVYAPENLYIDDVKVTQNYQAGDVFSDPFVYKRFVEGTSAPVNVPTRVFGNEMKHQVSAVKVGSRPYEYQGLKETKYCDLRVIGVCPIPSSIESANVGLSNATVQVVNDRININNPEGGVVRIYSFDGKLVYSDNSGNKSIVVDLGASGSYIVKVGNHSVKLTY